MKAAHCLGYGASDQVLIKEIPTPSVGDNDILIRVHAASVSAADYRIRQMDMPGGFGLLGRLIFGLSKPRQPILGSDLSGEVIAIGKRVSAFTPGDRVVAATGMRLGAHADLCCLPDSGCIVRKPESLSHTDAVSLVFGGITALHFLQRCQLQPGEKLFINGASGAVGTALIQLGAHYGVTITAICRSTNHELALSLGAHQVIDYETDEIFTKGYQWDVIADVVGNLSYKNCKDNLSAGGRLLQITAGLGEMLRGPFINCYTQHRIIAGPAAEEVTLLQKLMDMASAGIIRPVIDHLYPFDNIQAAHDRVDTGRKRGAVVVTFP